jgi:hypothetical protein
MSRAKREGRRFDSGRRLSHNKGLTSGNTVRPFFMSTDSCPPACRAGYAGGKRGLRQGFFPRCMHCMGRHATTVVAGVANGSDLSCEKVVVGSPYVRNRDSACWCLGEVRPHSQGNFHSRRCPHLDAQPRRSASVNAGARLRVLPRPHRGDQRREHVPSGWRRPSHQAASSRRQGPPSCR